MRISQRDRSEYERLRRNLLNKAERVKAQHNINFLNENPELKMKPLENMSRSEFNNFKEQARVMTKRGVQRFSYEKLNDHVSVSRSEARRLRESAALAQKQAAQRLEKVADRPLYRGDKPQQTTVGDRVQVMKDPDIPGVSAPDLQDDQKIRSRNYVQSKIKQFERYVDQQDYKKRQSILQDNFINKVKEVFNSDGNSITELIENMSPEDFIEAYSMSDDLNIDHFYLEDMEQLQARVDNIESFINKYNSGQVDLDFKRARDNIQ